MAPPESRTATQLKLRAIALPCTEDMHCPEQTTLLGIGAALALIVANALPATIASTALAASTVVSTATVAATLASTLEMHPSLHLWPDSTPPRAACEQLPARGAGRCR